MGALVGLGVDIGLMLIWSAFFLPRRPRSTPRKQGRLAMLLARAGLGQVAVNGFVIQCLAFGAVTALVLQLVSGTPPVALAFGLIGSYLPVAVVGGRARRRQREFAEVWPTSRHPAGSRSRPPRSAPAPPYRRRETHPSLLPAGPRPRAVWRSDETLLNWLSSL